MRCRGAQEDPQKRAVCLLSHYEKSRVTVKPKSSQDPAGPQVAGPLLSSLCSLSSESCRVSSVPLTFYTRSNLGAFALAAPSAWDALPPNTHVNPPAFKSQSMYHLLSEAFPWPLSPLSPSIFRIQSFSLVRSLLDLYTY